MQEPATTKTYTEAGKLISEVKSHYDPLTRIKTWEEKFDATGKLFATRWFDRESGKLYGETDYHQNGSRTEKRFSLVNGNLVNQKKYDAAGKMIWSGSSEVWNRLANPAPIAEQKRTNNTPFNELSEKTRAALLNPKGPGLPAVGTGFQPINILINPNPKPQTKFQNETQLQRDISNGFVVNRPTHQVSFPGKELDDTSFASTQIGGIATGGIRPGEIQRDPNPRPNKYLSDNLISIARVIPGLGSAANAVNAIVTNGLSAAMTRNVFVDPIVLDLSGAGVKLTSVGDGVLFDINNSGTQKRSGWTKEGAGLLVVDTGDGKIVNASQLLSEYYGGKQGTNGGPGQTPFKDGFAALASEDKNWDLLIDKKDPIWAKLKVWVDANHNGSSDQGELKTLESLGITQFDLKVKKSAPGELRDGNEVLAKGTFTINGKSREALAVNFIADPVSNIFKTVAGGVEITSVAGQVTKKSYVGSSAQGENLDAKRLGVNNLYGGQGNDTLTAAPNGSWLTGGGGSNIYNGSNADDVFVISASDNPENIHGNGGRDAAIIIGDEAVTLDMAKAGLLIAQGGRGDDIIRSGGSSGVFIKGGSGNQTLIGGGGNDVISGGSGSNIIVGGTGKAMIYAGPNGDMILASDGGSIINAGGGSDLIYGRAGDDVFIMGRGNAAIDGGAGTNIVEFHGGYGDYIIRRNGESYVVTDKVKGRDGTVTFRNIQKLNFSDISGIELAGANPLPVADDLRVDKNGKPFGRTQSHLISADQLLANDHRFQSTGKLKVNSVSDAVGGTASLTPAGDVLFTPDKNFTGIMSFKYDLQNELGHASASVLDLASGETAPMRAVATLLTPEIPSDPLASRQWYLSDVNIFPVWRDYTGKGVRVGQFEPGGKFSVGPETFNYEHRDLKANVDNVWLATAKQNKSLPDANSDHATMVAGVIAAAKNGEGGVGIAYGATIGGHYLDNGGVDLTGLGKMVSYDVANNSWGFATDFLRSNLQKGLISDSTAMLTNTQYAAQNGRGGLGTVIVAAGGNQREAGGSAQGSLTNNNRFVVQVGAINAQSDLSTLQIGSKPFSNPGASLLVAAPGSNVVSTGQLIETEGGSTFGSSYNTLNGTSFATPIVSGIVATMLQANPNLGYRDIQTILALSARRVYDASTIWTNNSAKNWNGGGMHVSHDYGFGKVDALAAVRLAESWMAKNTGDNEFVVSSASSTPFNVKAGETMTSSVQLTGGIKVEHVEIDFEAEVGRLGDLIVSLIAPDGTTSVLLDRHGKKPAGVAGSGIADRGNGFAGSFKYTFMTTHNWGGDSAGKWTLKVTDAENGLPVKVDRWGLRAYGAKASADDTYFFTNEYVQLAAAAPQRKVIEDAVNGTAGGRNTINAAAVSSDVRVNLTTATAKIGETVLTVRSMANIITGDGNDTLIAWKEDAILDGQRGNNVLTGGTGKDFFVVHSRTTGSDTINNFNPAAGEKIDLVGFKGKKFADLVLTQKGSDVLVNPGTGQTILLTNHTVNALKAEHFLFQDTFIAPIEYVQKGAAPIVAVAGLGTIILQDGGGGVSFQGMPDGTQKASLSGTIYSRDGAASDTFVVAKQTGVSSYRNAVRGFKHGVDKIDLRQLGITGFDDLIIEKANRVTINGLSLIHGVNVKSKSLGQEDPPVVLVYLDALDLAQVTAGDFLFAQPQPRPVAVVKESVSPAPAVTPPASNPPSAVDEKIAASKEKPKTGGEQVPPPGTKP